MQTDPTQVRIESSSTFCTYPHTWAYAYCPVGSLNNNPVASSTRRIGKSEKTSPIFRPAHNGYDISKHWKNDNKFKEYSQNNMIG